MDPCRSRKHNVPTSVVFGAAHPGDPRSITAKHPASRSSSSCSGLAKIRQDSTSTLGWHTRWSGSPTRWCVTEIPSSVGDQLPFPDFEHVSRSLACDTFDICFTFHSFYFVYSFRLKSARDKFRHFLWKDSKSNEFFYFILYMNFFYKIFRVINNKKMYNFIVLKHL